MREWTQVDGRNQVVTTVDGSEIPNNHLEWWKTPTKNWENRHTKVVQDFGPINSSI